MKLTFKPMRRQLVLGGMVSAVLVASGCSKSTKPKGQTLAKEATLLCLGDSLTFGFGAAPNAGYPQQLEQITGHAAQNAGVNGDTSEGALARLPGLLEASKPGLVLISIGGNDFLRAAPLGPVQAALKQMVQIASASSQVVLIAQPKPALMAAVIGSLDDHPVYSEVAKETGVALFSDAWSYVLSRSELRSDQIHANAEGYRIFAERLAAWLREQKYVA
jgi:acyl-CoA thioesterase I